MITKQNIRYFNFAKEAAKFSDFNRYNWYISIGCVIIYKSCVLSVGFNTNKTHPLQKEYNKYRTFKNPKNNIYHKLHAELMCLNKIKNLDIDWSKVEIYIYRENKEGMKALAYPCKACKEFIKSLGIKHIFYTGSDSYCEERL
jgi:deoxycytidylate deaminase